MIKLEINFISDRIYEIHVWYENGIKMIEYDNINNVNNCCIWNNDGNIIEQNSILFKIIKNGFNETVNKIYSSIIDDEYYKLCRLVWIY